MSHWITRIALVTVSPLFLAAHPAPAPDPTTTTADASELRAPAHPGAAAPAPTTSGAIVIGGVPYIETGQRETVVASFLTPDGAVTHAGYSGLVKITVSGSGESFFSALNDAFYVYTDPAQVPITPYHDPDHYQATASDQTLVGFGQPGYETQQVYRKIHFDIDAGLEVVPNYVPAYRADHRYQLVIATGLTAPGTLHFGVADGNFSENAGSYKIEIAQLGDARPSIECHRVAVLWPPDHRLVDVASAFRVSSPGDSATTYSMRVWSDEPEVTIADGWFAPDFIDQHNAGGGVFLRAERWWVGDGRFYVADISARNQYGSTTARCVLAVVPHSVSAIGQVMAQTERGFAPFEQGVTLGK